MSDIDDFGAWIVKNQALKGTPDFETVAKAFKELDAAQNPAKPQEKPEDIGILSGTAAALGRGFESFGDVYGGLKLGATHTLGNDEAAAQQMAAMKADKLKPQEKPAMTWADMERIYADKGLLSAAAELPKYATESIAQSAPEMATPLVVGAGVTAASAPVVGPFAPLVGGAAGILTYGIQQAGHFLTTQGEEKKNPEQLEVGKALATAAATAPLGYLVDKWTLGLGSLTEKQVGKELLKRYTADEIGLGGVAAGASATVAKGIGKGFFAEAPVEVVEQVAQRWQAGQDLNSPDAIAAYKEAWFGAGVSGGVMKGTVSGYQAYQGFNTPEGPAPTPTVPTTPVAPTPPAATTPPDADQAVVDAFNMTEEERAAKPVATPIAESVPVAKPVAKSTPAVETPQVFTVEDPVAKSGIHKEFDTLEAAEAHVDTIAANRTALIEGHQDNIAAHNEDIATLQQGLDTEIAKGGYGTPQFLTHEANINNEISLLNDKIMTEQAQVSNLSQPVQIVSPTNAIVEVKAVQATPIAPTPITPAPAPLEGVTEPVYTPELAAKIKQLRKSLLPTLERFGLKDVGLNIVASIENGTANAHYVEQVMQIAYNANDPMGSLRHESIHALKELGAFTENEWRVLSQRAKDTWVNQFISEKNQAKYAEEYPKYKKTMDGFDAYLQEEAIAEAFKHFANTKPPAGLIGKLYSRLNNMFQSLGNSFKQLGYTNAEAIFQKIERGEAKPKKVEKVAEKIAEKPVKVKKAPEAKKVVEKAPEAKKVAPAQGRYQEWLDKVATRMAKEGAAQEILDDMEENNVSVNGVTKTFWDKTYFNLPAQAQKIFRKDLAEHSGAGNNIDGDINSQVKNLDLPNEVQYLEGTERGFVALMFEANRRFAPEETTKIEKAPKAIKAPEVAEKPVKVEKAPEVKEQAQVTVNLSNVTKSIPGLQELYARAMAGDKAAYTTLQRTADSHLRHLLSAINVNVDIQHVMGAYSSEREPALNVVLTVAETDKAKVMASLARFAHNFNQEQIHVRQLTTEKIGHDFGDGSYATPVYTIDAKNALTNDDIANIIEKTGIPALTVVDNKIITYWVEPNEKSESGFKEYIAQVKALTKLVGASGKRVIVGVERLYVYGTGYGARLEFDSIEGDVRSKEKADTTTARLIGGYFKGEPLTTFKQTDLTKTEVADQEHLAKIFEELPVNGLKLPIVRRAYNALITELVEQFKVLPIKVEVVTDVIIDGKSYSYFGKDASALKKALGMGMVEADVNKAIKYLQDNYGEPNPAWKTGLLSRIVADNKDIYGSSEDVMRDVGEHNTLKLYKTSPETFGVSAAEFKSHPLLKPSGLKDSKGYPMLYNDLFRAVHDYYAHNLSETQFGPKGEFAAAKNHLSLTKDPMAKWALIAETRMQNAWQNFRSGVEKTPLKDRSFSEQKVALPPLKYVLTGDNAIDASVYKLASELTAQQRLGSLSPDSKLAEGMDKPFAKETKPVKKSELEAIWNSYRHTALPFSSLSKEDIQVLARVKDKDDEVIDRAVQKIYKAIEQAPTEAEVEAVAAQEIDTKEVAQEEEEVQPEEEEEPQAKTDKAAIKTQKALDKAAVKAQKVLDKAADKIEAKALKLRIKEAVKQAKRDIDNSEVGQALQRVQDENFDMDDKKDIRSFYKKLVKHEILEEGGDTQEYLSDRESDVSSVLYAIENELQDAYDNALQERIDEVTEEAEYQTDEAPRGRFQFKEEEEYIPATLTEKFKRWFGNSEIVNRDGSPKQMYHATARDITIFTPKQANAIFLTDSPDFAQTFAETSEDYMIAEAKANMSEAELDRLRAQAEKISKKEGTSYADELYALIRDTLPSGQNILPVYVSAKNVFDFENPAHLHLLSALPELQQKSKIERVKIGSWDVIESESVQAVIRKAGFDGFYVLEGGKKNLGVYTSNQIKSSIGNNGEFDINNPDIRYQFKEDEEFVEPSGKIDNVTYLLVDKFVDLKRVIQSINKRGKVIADKWNAYLQEELYHSKVSTRIDFFMKRQLNPVLKQMDAAGIAVVDMDNYLLARHASEANAHIANVNADPSANAGMTNDEALEYMDAIPANKRQVYERIANQIDSMTKETREMMVSYGLEKQGVIDSWEHAYKHYVPLMREQDESDTGSLSFGTGKGYSVKGKTVKARIGSSKAVVDVLANIALQRERIIARGEKNRVGQSLLGLVLTNPSKDFWVAVNPHIGNKNLTKELTELGLDPSVSQNLGEAPIERVPNAKTGEAQTQINPLWRKQPNVFITRVNGEDRVIIFNMKDARAKRMAVSFSNLTTQNKAEVIKMEGEAGAYWEGITKNVGKGTRYFASINTQYNPAFGLYNLLRDIGGATLNLQSTALKGKEFKVITNAFVALRAVYKDLRLQREGKVIAKDPSGKFSWAEKFEEFELAGGKTGFSDLFNNSEEKALKLQKEINSFGKHGVKETRDAVLGWLSDFNSAIENCIRVSAYNEGIKSGLSQDQSASIAKNLTVNFNRTGARTKLFTPLYAFFNASVQGTARIAETMYKDGKLTPAGKKIVAGSVILGVIQAVTIAAAGFDENDPPEWVKDKNIIIPYGNKKYIAIPMPLGFNIFPSFARRVTEFAMSDEKNIGKAATSTFTMILDGFNPLGSGTLMQTALPTLLDPIAAIAENRDFSGRPIARDDMNSLEPTPGYSRAKENASSISTGIAYAINILTGGTEFQKGFISPTPDTLDYLAGQATGGVGREIMKIGKAGSALATGEELSTSNVPIVGRMIGNANQRSAETARFYENIKRLNEHKAEIEGRAKSDQEIDAYMEKHPDSALYQEAGKFYKQISDLHKAKKELKLMGADKEDIKALDDAALEYMVVVNEIVRDFKHNN